MSEVLKKFGRYFLLDQIAQGGMAEISRARLASPDGAGRLLVIKRIQAGFGANAEFLQMFKSEIKVTMGFNHSNIVQLYDFGEEQNQPYIAMEYVDGKNLRQFLNRFKEMKQAFPTEFAAHIIEQSAAGLHYAHSFKDKFSGEPLCIVHRDISPQNIIISFEGNVKIIDFGIAKATTNSEQTRAGVIKGKPSYLSPEQISGDVLDGRTDLFALGAVFWELLTGRKLFAGDNDLAVLKLIESCTTTVVPPSALNPAVPKELDAIVMKMLSKQPELRYQNGEELSRALRKFLVTTAPDFSPSDLAHASKEIFNKEIVEDRKRITRLNDRVEQLLIMAEATPEPAAELPTGNRPDETTTFVATRPTMAAAKAEFSMDQQSSNQPLTVESTRVNRTRTSASHPESTYGARTATGTPANGSYQATRTANRPSSNSGGGFGPVLWLAAIGACGGFVFVAPKFGVRIPFISKSPATVAVEDAPSAEPTVDPKTVQVPIAAETPSAPTIRARLKLNIFPAGAPKQISVNGRLVDPANPVIEVITEAPLELAVEREGFQTFTSEFTIDSRVLGDNGEYVKEIVMEPVTVNPDRELASMKEDFGFLNVSSTPPSEATIYVNGKLFARKVVPVERMKAPAGEYEVRFYSATLDMEDRQKFTLEKNRTQSRTVNLKRRK